MPRWVPERRDQEGDLKAVRAAWTALVMSVGVAVWTAQMGSSVLRRSVHVGEGERGMAYVGFMVVRVCPLPGMNSLLMKSPVGCAHVLPLGAVSCTSGGLVV